MASGTPCCREEGQHLLLGGGEGKMAFLLLGYEEGWPDPEVGKEVGGVQIYFAGSGRVGWLK